MRAPAPGLTPRDARAQVHEHTGVQVSRRALYTVIRENTRGWFANDERGPSYVKLSPAGKRKFRAHNFSPKKGAAKRFKGR